MSNVKIVNKDKNGFSIKIDFRYGDSMLDLEDEIQKKLNEAGTIATGEVLAQFDNDGSPIIMGDQTFTTKGQFEKNYQTPYGETRVLRHVYQSHSGGKTFCPLEQSARIVITSTPLFAKMVTSKFSNISTQAVKKDFADNHNRYINKKTIQTICEAVGSVALAKEAMWEYLPNPNDYDNVSILSFGLDGTCMQMRKDGWREAMTGTISLYDKLGNRLHTSYLAAPPEYGKESFLEKMEESINKTKNLFPDTKTIGLADGARDNWSFLEEFSDYKVLDFYHASEYLGSYSKAVYKDSEEQKVWLENACHNLKNKIGSASRLLSEMESVTRKKHLKKDRETIKKCITYFKNNIEKMKYKKIIDMNAPIGSGVTEAACKVIVKERMCKSGMRWQNEGAQVVLKLRTMEKTEGHWDHFWKKIDKFGFELAA